MPLESTALTGSGCQTMLRPTTSQPIFNYNNTIKIHYKSLDVVERLLTVDKVNVFNELLC